VQTSAIGPDMIIFDRRAVPPSWRCRGRQPDAVKGNEVGGHGGGGGDEQVCVVPPPEAGIAARL
jgi:hypothetical protein